MRCFNKMPYQYCYKFETAMLVFFVCITICTCTVCSICDELSWLLQFIIFITYFWPVAVGASVILEVCFKDLKANLWV